MNGRGRLVVHGALLISLVMAVAPFERKLAAAASVPELVPSGAEPPHGTDIDPSDLPALASAPPVPLPDRPGAAAPAVSCSELVGAGTAPIPPATTAVPAQAASTECATDVKVPVDEPFPSKGADSGFVPGRSSEAIAERDAFTAVFDNPDGSRTLRLSDLPQHFEVAPGRWEPIDSSVKPVAGRSAEYATTANAWTASFSSVGMAIATDDGDVAFSFVADRPVAPMVTEDGSVVSYTAVWPGVDVEYRPGPSGVEEYLHVRDRQVPLELEFALSGARVVGATETGGVRLDVGDIEVSGLVTFGRDGVGLPLEGSPRLAARADRLVVVIDEQWLAAVPDEAFPLTIDPGFWIGSEYRRCFAKSRFGNPAQYSCTSGANAGNTPTVPSDWNTWRSAMWFDYWSHVTADSVVTSAVLELGWVSYPGNEGWRWVNVHEGYGSFGTADYYSLNPTAEASAVIGSWPTYPPTNAQFDVTDLVDWWVATGNPYGFFMATGEEPGTAAHTFKKFTHVMWLTTNLPPDAPSLQTPPHGSTTPNSNLTFSVLPASDPDGDLVQYQFVGSGAPGCGADRFNSGFSGSTSFNWTSPPAFDNTTTYWCAFTRDDFHGPVVHWGFEGGAAVTVVKPPNQLAAVTLVSPATGALRVTDTPAVTATVGVDPEGQPTSFRFVLSPADGVGLQAASEWRSGPATNSTWTVPAGLLDPTTIYRWGVELTDTVDTATPKWNTMRVEQYLGTGTVAPMQAVGPVSVNLATGNLAFATGSPAVTTVSGPVGVSYAFNSQDRTNLGLRGTYFNDANGNLYRDGTEQIYLARRDAVPSFDWGLGSPSPSVPVDHFSAQWHGYITVPHTGQWQFRIAHDDRVYMRINNTVVYNVGCCGTGVSTPINLTQGQPTLFELFYLEGEQPAYMRIQAIRDGVSYALDPAWFTTRSMPLPLGWTMTGITGDTIEYGEAHVSDSGVLLTRPDGTQELFAKTAGGGYTPPHGIDDTVTVNTATGAVTVLTASGIEQQFDARGAMTSARTVIDDRQPAAPTRTYADAADGTPRLRTVADPGRGGTTILTLDYQGGPGTCPPTSDAPQGMLCRLTYVDGTSTELRYTTGGQLTTILDPGDERTDIAYDAQQLVASIRDPLVNDWLASTAYDGSDPNQFLTTIGYTNGKVTSVTQPAPSAAAPRPGASMSYNSGTSSVTQAGLAGGPHRVAAFDAAGRMTSDTDAVGRVASVVLDDKDRALSSDAGGRRSTNIYNDLDQLTDTFGPAPTSCFGANRLPNGSCVGGVPHTNTVYDGGIAGLAFTFWNNTTHSGVTAGHATLAAAGLNLQWGAGSPAPNVATDNFSYQATGRLNVSTTGAWEFRVTADDNATLFVDDQPVVTATVGTPATGTVNPLTAGSHRIRVQGVELGGAAAIFVEWRLNGGAWSIIPGTALSPNYGLTTRATTEDGGVAPSTVTATRYTDGGLDASYGLVTATVEDPDGLAHTESTTYETPGTGLLRRKTRTLPGGNTYNYDHYAPGATPAAAACGVSGNQAGLMRTRTSPAAAIVDETVYDTIGRPKATRTGADPWTCTTYDGRGRTTIVDIPAIGPNPARSVSTTYNTGGDPRVTAVTDTAGTITTRTDLLGRVVSYTDVWNITSTVGYDQAGRPTSGTGLAGNVVSAYDNVNRLLSMSIAGTQIASVTYRPDNATLDPGAAATYTYSNNTVGTVTYDNLGRVSSLSWNKTSGTLLTKDAVTRSLTGRVLTSTIDNAATPTYTHTYDTVGRLVRTMTTGLAGTHDYAYCYDQQIEGICTATDVSTQSGGYNAGRNSNRTTSKDNGVVKARFTYDAADRLTTVTPIGTSSASPYDDGPITYDQHGNTITLADETLHYDQTDRHIRTVYALAGSRNVVYTRDPLDTIVQRTPSSGTTYRYSYSAAGDTGDATLSSTGQLIETLFSLHGGVLYTRPASGSGGKWSYPNIHGDIAARASSTGSKSGATYVYQPFGEPSAIIDNQTGDLDNAWLGQHQRVLEHASTIQPKIEMGARPYDPVLGRFITVDPVEGGINNDYGYVGDPINEFDITGECLRKRPKWGGYIENGKRPRGKYCRGHEPRFVRTVSVNHNPFRGASGRGWIARATTVILASGVAGGICVGTGGLGCAAAFGGAGALTGVAWEATGRKPGNLTCAAVGGAVGGAASGQISNALAQSLLTEAISRATRRSIGC